MGVYHRPIVHKKMIKNIQGEWTQTILFTIHPLTFNLQF